MYMGRRYVPSRTDYAIGAILICVVMAYLCNELVPQALRLHAQLQWPTQKVQIETWNVTGRTEGGHRSWPRRLVSVDYSYLDSTGAKRAGASEVKLSSSEYRQFLADRESGLGVPLMVNPADEEETYLDIHSSSARTRNILLLICGAGVCLAIASVVNAARTFIQL